MVVEKVDCNGRLYCDRDARLCNRCGECGVTEWANKYHEQIYHTFLTLSGISCCTIWPNPPEIRFSDTPLAFQDDEYIHRTMDFAGYDYRRLRHTPEEELKALIVQSIDNDWPLLAYNLVNQDWCLVCGYDADGGTLFGRYTAESWDDPQQKPDSVEAGLFTKTGWYDDAVEFLQITGKIPPREDYAELLIRLREILLCPGNTVHTSGLAAFDACRAAVLDDDRFSFASSEYLTQLYTMVHVFIGVLAESRCFAAFAFFAGFFGRISDETVLARMKRVGEIFMDTHNQCWGAWAVLGKDHHCQPDLYGDTFIQRETREKIAQYIDIFRANDEKVVRVLDEIISRSSIL